MVSHSRRMKHRRLEKPRAARKQAEVLAARKLSANYQQPRFAAAGPPLPVLLLRARATPRSSLARTMSSGGWSVIPCQYREREWQAIVLAEVALPSL